MEISTEPRETLYRQILAEKEQIVAELEQLIREANDWNGLPQAARQTINIERDRLALLFANESLRLWVEGRTVESQRHWNQMLKILESTVNAS